MTLQQLIRYCMSKQLLLAPWFLLTLITVNGLGTIYGYMWYWQQLKLTVAEQSRVLAIFVPDSPTASLFFTLSLVYLVFDQRHEGRIERHSSAGSRKRAGWLRGLIEAYGVITSIKYGIWAVTMIAAGAAQGNPIVWEEWMLVFSHTAMVFEAVLFFQFFRMRWKHAAVIALWTLCNDYIDYHAQVYPWLPRVLENDLPVIERFTVFLSAASVCLTAYMIKLKQADRSKLDIPPIR